MNSVKKQITELISLASEGLYEKQHIMSVALLCSLAGESIFLLGPPGTAKSMIARRLKMIFKDAKSFEYLMSRFSTPDEIFGPVSIAKLKNEDTYERLVEDYLPNAEVVFLDEIWKAGPAIQNTLLTVLNEHIYRNGKQTIHLPLKALIAASNELPEEGQGLEALWDRFIVRITCECISTEEIFYEMISDTENNDVVIPDELLITNDTYMSWREGINKVSVPKIILEGITSIRSDLTALSTKDTGSNPLDFYVSDRRWKKLVHIMRASAFFNGRDTINVSDMAILFHCLWNKEEHRKNIADIVCSGMTSFLFSRLSETKKKSMDNLYESLMNRFPENSDNDIERFLIINNGYYRFKINDKSYGFIPKTEYELLDYNKASTVICYLSDDKYIIKVIPDNGIDIGKFLPKLTYKTFKAKKWEDGLVIENKKYALEKSNPNSLMKEINLIKEENKKKENAIRTDMNKCFEENDEIIKDLVSEIKSRDNIFISEEDFRTIHEHLMKVKKDMKATKLKLESNMN